MVLFNQDEDAEAIVLYDKILAIDPNHSMSHSCKGRIYTAGGMHQRAIECCEKAIEADHNNYEGHFGRGNALRALRNLDEALQCYNKAIELKPTILLSLLQQRTRTTGPRTRSRSNKILQQRDTSRSNRL